MKGRTVKRCIFVAAVLFLLAGIWIFTRPSTPESQFRDFFADLPMGVPAYQKILSFNRPADAIRNDFCTTEFVQSSAEFNQFVMRLGVSQESILSSNGVSVKANSALSSGYPWILQVKSKRYDSAGNAFLVRIEGQQPYNNPSPPAKTN
jgi:hypothetical protein